jgi:hypothetical protein
MFKVILLVCAASVTPGDCQADTPLYLLNGPDATNEVMCGIGQSLVYGEYLKIVCQRGPRERVLEEASARP